MEYSMYTYASMTAGKWDDVVQDSSTARRDLTDGAKCILKWSGSRPSWITSEAITVYDRSGVCGQIISDGDWNLED